MNPYAQFLIDAQKQWIDTLKQITVVQEQCLAAMQAGRAPGAEVTRPHEVIETTFDIAARCLDVQKAVALSVASAFTPRGSAEAEPSA